MASGTSAMDATIVSAAYHHLDELHRPRTCSDKKILLLCLSGTPTQKDVQRAGISNDLNAAVRTFWYALATGHSLVVPDAAWHWLEGSTTPLNEVLVESTCARELRRRGATISCINTSLDYRMHAAADLGYSAVALAHGSWYRRNGLSVKHIPVPFQRIGVLGWMQILTTYLVRLRGSAAHRVQQQLHAHITARVSSLPPTHSHASNTCGRIDHIALLDRDTRDGAGWLPPVGFSLGMHLRWGDACGVGYHDARRRCHVIRGPNGQPSLAPAARTVATHGFVPRSGQSVFLATDSETVASEAQTATAAAFEGGVLGSSPITFQRISRRKYEPADRAFSHRSNVWIENRAEEEDATWRRSVWDETMLDLLMLSRAGVIAGAMMGNMPRLAMQMRLATACPAISLDGREWCPAIFCTAAIPKGNATFKARRVVSIASGPTKSTRSISETMVLTNESQLSITIALQLSGHLRQVCNSVDHLRPLATLVRQCRLVAARCDVLIHTWDTLEPTTSTWHTARPLKASSALPCAQRLREELRATAVTVAPQERSTLPEANRTWALVTPHGHVQKITTLSMAGVRASITGVAAAKALRYSTERKVRGYDVAVKLRPDLYSRRGPQYGRPNAQICSVPTAAWGVMVAHAKAVKARRMIAMEQAEGTVQAQVRSTSILKGEPADEATVYSCDDDAAPGDKGADMCLWSSPPTALDDLIKSWDALAPAYLEANACWQDWRRTAPAADPAASPCTVPSVDTRKLAYPELILAAAINTSRLRALPLSGGMPSMPRGPVRQTAYCPHRMPPMKVNATLRLLARGVRW